MIYNHSFSWNLYTLTEFIWLYSPHGQQYSILQKKRAGNSVPKCPCKLLQPADWPMAGSSSLEGHFGTGLCVRFSSAWSNVECDSPNLFFYLNYLIPVFSFLSLTKKCTLLAKSQLAFWKLWNGLAMPNILFRWCNLLDAINILISEDQAIKRQARAKPEIWK